MGSKNLKAIIAYGNKGIKIVNPKRLIERTEMILKRFKSNPRYQKQLELGTMEGFPTGVDLHGLSVNNWTGRFPTEEALRTYDNQYYLEKFKAGRVVDPTCPLGCKDHVKIKEGEYAGTEAYISVFYGGVVRMAARCQVGTYEKNIKAQEFFQRTGICVHAFTALIDWAVDLYERGILTKEDTGGVELRHDFETTMFLADQANKREGLGGILSQGFNKAIEDIGRGCEKYAVTIKGTDPVFDPRIYRLSGPAFNQVVNPRGAHAPQCLMPYGLYMSKGSTVEPFKGWLKEKGVSDKAIERICPQPGYLNVGRMTPYSEDWITFMNSVGLGCIRGRVDDLFKSQDWTEIYGAVTGFAMSLEDFWKAAKRIYNLYKALNVRLGFSRKDDVFPDRWFEPLETTDRGTLGLRDHFEHPLTRDDCQKLLDDYYDERGWDIGTGIPTEKTLSELGLEDVIKDLKKGVSSTIKGDSRTHASPSRPLRSFDRALG
jgi:aldehyde:ferredoxin oxidoreductase